MTSKAKGGLGKGLGALIPSSLEKGKMVEIPIDEIVPNPYQPRKSLDEESLNELAESIRQHGILQPIVVRKVEKGYEIIAGERRYKAAMKAGLGKVPAIIKEATDEELMEYALIENLQREDLNPIEAAYALKRLMDTFQLTQEEIADKIGKRRSTIANLLRLLKLPEDIQRMVSEGRLTMGHARALLSVDDPEEQRRLAEEIVSRSLSVREVEKEVSRKVKVLERDKSIEESFIKRYGVKLRVKRGDRKSVEIFFKEDSEMEEFLGMLEEFFSSRKDFLGNKG